MRSTRVILLCLSLMSLACALFAQSPSKVSYAVSNRFPLGGTGGWDYLAVDSTARRVYIARSDRVLVVDADSGKLVGEINGLARAHGVALATDLGRGFVTSGGQGTVIGFHLKALTTIAKIPAGSNPDAVVYDPRWKRIWAFNGGSNNVSVLDSTGLLSVRTIALPGKPEFAVLDPHGQIYVNLEDKGAIAQIDAYTMNITAQWPLAPCEQPTGLAIDVERGRLFAGCRNQKMAVIDVRTGKLLASLPIGKNCDGVAFDPSSRVAVSANGEGTLTVVAETAPGKFEVVQTVPTRAGARTITLDETTHSFWLPVGQMTKPVAEGSQPVNDNFELLVVSNVAAH